MGRNLVRAANPPVSKGRVTVPMEVREKLGLRPGTVIEFELREDGVLLGKGTRGTHPVDQVFGILKLKQAVDRLIDEMRGPSPKRG